MASWAEFETAEPDLAERVKALFRAHRHCFLATLRRHGSPRISGVEVGFDDEDIFIGAMARSVKAMDLLRDPRMALHSSSDDPPEGSPKDWPGDAKISGLAMETPLEQEQAGHRFRLDIREVVHTHLDPEATVLVIDSWHPGRGRGRHQRD